MSTTMYEKLSPIFSAYADKINQNASDITDVNSSLSELQNGGYVADAQQIEAKINAWLAEHPEATTTVQDGSLTSEKLVQGTIGFVTPEAFGAVGDGTTDDSVAINACFASHKCVVMTQDLYIQNPIVMGNDCVLDMNGFTIHIDDSVADGITATGSATSETTIVSGSKGYNTLTVADASSFSAGDTIFISDTGKSYVGGDNEGVDNWPGELAVIEKISGNVLYLCSKLADSYDDPTENSSVMLVTPVKNVTIKNGRIIGSGSTTQSGIALTYCVNVAIENVCIEYTCFDGIRFYYCMNFKVEGCAIDHIYHSSSLDSYGIGVKSSQYGLIRGCNIKNCKHAIAHGGPYPTRYVVTDGCVLSTPDNTNYCFDTHSTADYITLKNSIVYTGIVVGAKHFKCIGNKIYSRTGSFYCIYIGNRVVTLDIEIVENTIIANTNTQNVMYFAGSSLSDLNALIKGNVISANHTCRAVHMVISASTLFGVSVPCVVHKVDISENIIEMPSYSDDNNIYINIVNDGSSMEQFIMRDNDITGVRVLVNAVNPDIVDIANNRLINSRVNIAGSGGMMLNYCENYTENEIGNCFSGLGFTKIRAANNVFNALSVPDGTTTAFQFGGNSEDTIVDVHENIMIGEATTRGCEFRNSIVKAIYNVNVMNTSDGTDATMYYFQSGFSGDKVVFSIA